MNRIRVTGCGEYILTKPKNNIYDQFWAQNHVDGFGAADYPPPLGFAAATVNPSPLTQTSKVTVKGVVKDAAGAPLLGVTVIVKGTSVGTSTSIDGEYQIQCAADAELDFSFIGYETQTLPVANRTLLNVTLKEDAQLMDEVIVIGYGTTTRRRAVGAVDQIKSEAITERSVANLTQALQGTSPSLVIQQRSSDPADNQLNINIRGIGTMNNNEPLIVIDGLVSDNASFNKLNPSDIENVSVLKDADAQFRHLRFARRQRRPAGHHQEGQAESGSDRRTHGYGRLAAARSALHARSRLAERHAAQHFQSQFGAGSRLYRRTDPRPQLYKLVNQPRLNGGYVKKRIVWNNETLRQDYGKDYLATVPKYDGFCTVPDHVSIEAILYRHLHLRSMPLKTMLMSMHRQLSGTLICCHQEN